jgi:hypothetical protein
MLSFENWLSAHANLPSKLTIILSENQMKRKKKNVDTSKVGREMHLSYLLPFFFV